MMRGLAVGAISGFLGASTFAYETRELIREGQLALAAGNAVGSVVSRVAGNLPLRPG